MRVRFTNSERQKFLSPPNLPYLLGFRLGVSIYGFYKVFAELFDFPSRECRIKRPFPLYSSPSGISSSSSFWAARAKLQILSPSLRRITITPPAVRP